MRRALFIAALLVAVHVRADVVVLRDGSQQSGTVELCDDESCRLSGKRIPTGEIRAIYFGNAKVDNSPRSTGIVMRDGSLRKGQVTFINRGVVDLDGQEIDRDRVTAVILVANEKPPDDVLILRSALVVRGTVTSCNAASCSLDGAITPLADIEWAGFAREDIVPPSTSGGDEVHKIDGTILSARLSALSADTLSTTRGPVPRADVAWVHVAPPAPAPQPQPSGFGAPQSPPPGAPSPSTPPTGGSPAPQPSPQPPPQPSGGGSRSRTGWPPPRLKPDGPPVMGGLWTGTVISRYRDNRDGILHRWDIDARVRLREKVGQLLFGTGANFRTIGSMTKLIHEGSVVTEKVSCSGDFSCSGEGTVSVSGEENSGACSSIWWKNEAIDLTAPYGFDIPANGLYTVCLAFPEDARFTVTYRAVDGTPSSWDTNYISPVIGRHPVLPRSHFMDPDTRNFPGGVAQMTGSFFQPANESYGSLSVSWSICRETGNCPPPGPLPPEPEAADDCPPPSPQEALLTRALMELKAKVEVASELEAEYKRIENEARQWEGDYIDVTWDCRLFAAAKTLTGFLLGNFAPKIPPRVLASPTGPGTLRIDQLPGIEPGKTFVNFVNFIEKVSDGDASWLIPDTEFGDWVSGEDVWDGVTIGWGALQSQGASPAQMRESLLSCGAPSIAGAIEGALTYLRLLENMRPLGDRMNTVKNNIRSLENQIEGDLWPKWQRECQRYEECREGGDASRCNQPPATYAP